RCLGGDRDERGEVHPEKLEMAAHCQIQEFVPVEAVGRDEIDDDVEQQHSGAEHRQPRAHARPRAHPIRRTHLLVIDGIKPICPPAEGEGSGGCRYFLPMPPRPPVTGTAWREARALIWKYRSRLALGIGLMLVNRLASFVLPASSKYLIDNVLTRG